MATLSSPAWHAFVVCVCVCVCRYRMSGRYSAALELGREIAAVHDALNVDHYMAFGCLISSWLVAGRVGTIKHAAVGGASRACGIQRRLVVVSRSLAPTGLNNFGPKL